MYLSSINYSAMGDKTPESLSMDDYFDRLRSDHSPSILARSGRTNRCKPRSRLSTKCPPSAKSKKRLVFDDDNDIARKRKVMRPIDVFEFESLSADEDSKDSKESNKNKVSPKGDQNKRRRSFSVGEESSDTKISVSDEVVAARSPSRIVPFEDENGNNSLVRPEMRRMFTEHRDDQSKKESIERARRVKAMEQFQKDVLNSGEDWESHHGSEVETDLDEDLFDDFNHLQME